MKKNLLLLLLLTPFITNTAESDYRLALRAAIENKNTEEVQSILDKLPKGTIPHVNSKNNSSTNPLFIDTNPAIVKILIDSQVFLTDSCPYRNLLARYQVDYQSDYASVALILSRGGPFSNYTSLYNALENKKDHRIIGALLMAGANPQGAPSGFLQCFLCLKQSIDSDPKNYAWGFLNWTAMTIATEKEDGWLHTLKKMLTVFPTPQLPQQLNSLKPRVIQERQRTKNINPHNKETDRFICLYKDRFESWLASDLPLSHDIEILF